MTNHTSGNDKTEPTLQELWSILGATELERRRGKFNDAKKQIQFELIKHLIEKAERKARLDELEKVLKEWAKGDDELLSDWIVKISQYMADRAEELSLKEKEL